MVGQVDRVNGLVGNLGMKAPVRAASTGNLTLSGEQTVDGVALVEWDRVLVKDQTTASENGIYDVQTGAWTRAADFDGSRDTLRGTAVKVAEGTTNANTEWTLATSDVTFGTTSLTFTQTFGASTAIHAATTKATPVAADEFGFWDSVSGLLRKLTWTNLIAALQTSLLFLQEGTSAVARALQDKLRESISVTDFGAVGDGATDDTAAIQAALFEAKTRSADPKDGFKCVFPPGVYNIAGLVVYPDSYLVFEPGAILNMTASGIAIRSAMQTGVTPPTGVVRRVTLENPTIEMNGYAGFGILAECADHWRITNPHITGVGTAAYTYDDGVSGDQPYDSTGIVLKGIDGVHGCYYNSVKNPRVVGTATTGGTGIWLGTSISLENQRANFNKITQAECWTLDAGIDIALGGDNYVELPEVSTCDVGIRVGSLGFVSDSRRNYIKMPYIEACATAGIQLRANALDTIIDGIAGTSGTTTPLEDNGVNTSFFAANSDSVSTNGFARFYKEGIRFSPLVANTDKDTNVNALDDYQEGDLVPTVVGSTAAGGGTYTVQYGSGTLIGDRFIFNLYLTWTAHTGTGNLRIKLNSPVTSETGNNLSPVSLYNSNIALTAGNALQGYVSPNSDYIEILQYPTGGGAAAAVPMDTAGSLAICGIFKVNH